MLASVVPLLNLKQWRKHTMVIILGHSIRGHNCDLFWPTPTSMWTFLTLDVHKNRHYLDHLPTSSCPGSHWTSNFSKEPSFLKQNRQWPLRSKTVLTKAPVKKHEDDVSSNYVQGKFGFIVATLFVFLLMFQYKRHEDDVTSNNLPRKIWL